jgi:hypothetical protein
MMRWMSSFNVFVLGPIAESPNALPALAEKMSQRYNLPAQELVTRMRRGRFRVKSNLDGPTADRYKKDLESIGARVLVEDASISPTATPVVGVPIEASTRAANVSLPPLSEMPQPPEQRQKQVSGAYSVRLETNASRQTPMPTRPTPNASTPPARPTPSPAVAATKTIMGGGDLRPPAAATRPPTAPARASTPDMASGLAAAYATPAHADLGALGQSNFSLASLDGEDAPPPPPAFDAPPQPDQAFEPPVEPKVSVKINAKPKSDGPKKPIVPAQALDLFAPPDAAEQNLVFDLAPEEIEERAKKKATAPPESAPVAARPVPSPSLSPAMQRPVGGPVMADTPGKPLDRVRFAAGVVVALVVGFLPVHVTAGMRERSAYAEIDKKVAAAYEAADSPETYAALDGAREKLLEEKEGARRNIAITSMLLWAVIAAGVAFVWFRKIPWDREA